MSNSTQKFTCVIDFSYDELMSPKVNVEFHTILFWILAACGVSFFISSSCVDKIGSNQMWKSSNALLFCQPTVVKSYAIALL